MPPPHSSGKKARRSLSLRRERLIQSHRGRTTDPQNPVNLYADEFGHSPSTGNAQTQSNNTLSPGGTQSGGADNNDESGDLNTDIGQPTEQADQTQSSAPQSQTPSPPSLTGNTGGVSGTDPSNKIWVVRLLASLVVSWYLL